MEKEKKKLVLDLISGQTNRINALESEIKTLRDEKKKSEESAKYWEKQFIKLGDEALSLEKELDFYKPAYEIHIKEIESLKLELLEKDKRINDLERIIEESLNKQGFYKSKE